MSWHFSAVAIHSVVIPVAVPSIAIPVAIVIPLMPLQFPLPPLPFPLLPLPLQLLDISFGWETQTPCPPPPTQQVVGWVVDVVCKAGHATTLLRQLFIALCVYSLLHLHTEASTFVVFFLVTEALQYYIVAKSLSRS